MKWAATAFSIAADVILSCVIAFFINRNDPLPIFGICLAILWALPIFISFFGFIKFWIWYHVAFKRMMVRIIKAEFHKNNFPKTSAFFDHAEYLNSVIMDEALPASIRIRASFLAGEISAIKNEKQFTKGFAISFAYDAAMEEYNPTPRLE